MVKFSYHQRVLPSPPAIDFASDEGKKLFRKAFLAGMMVGFFKLICYFQTQSELTYCGLASLAMVLNALHVDPGRTWKAPWRWFDESMLDCPERLEKVKAEGISFLEVAKLARRSGAEVEAFQTSQINVDFFRWSVKECSSSDNCHLISSYDRAALKQAGSGHFSPIGGYHEEDDMVLILDVARFKYPPHWVPLDLLWKAMDTVDKTTGKKRGFMLISKPKRDAGLLYTLDEHPVAFKSWKLKDAGDEHPVAFKSRKLRDAQRRYIVQEKVDPNPVINALSRPYCHCFKKGLKHDQRAQNRIGYAREIKIRCEKDLYAKVPQQYVPLLKKLRKELLCKRHDSKWAWPSSKINTIGLRCGTTLKRT